MLHVGNPLAELVQSVQIESVPDEFFWGKWMNSQQHQRQRLTRVCAAQQKALGEAFIDRVQRRNRLENEPDPLFPISRSSRDG